jgi:hypothetical protein
MCDLKAICPHSRPTAGRCRDIVEIQPVVDMRKPPLCESKTSLINRMPLLLFSLVMRSSLAQISRISIQARAGLSTSTIRAQHILSVHRLIRTMSQKPEIISVEEFKTDAKWLKLESIKYKDQTGKEVCRSAVAPLSFIQHRRRLILAHFRGCKQDDPEIWRRLYVSPSARLTGVCLLSNSRAHLHDP